MDMAFLCCPSNRLPSSFFLYWGVCVSVYKGFSCYPLPDLRLITVQHLIRCLHPFILYAPSLLAADVNVVNDSSGLTLIMPIESNRGGDPNVANKARPEVATLWLHCLLNIKLRSSHKS